MRFGISEYPNIQLSFLPSVRNGVPTHQMKIEIVTVTKNVNEVEYDHKCLRRCPCQRYADIDLRLTRLQSICCTSESLRAPSSSLRCQKNTIESNYSDECHVQLFQSRATLHDAPNSCQGFRRASISIFTESVSPGLKLSARIRYVLMQ